MATKYIFWRVPISINKNITNYKAEVLNDVKAKTGAEIKLSNVKFLNAIVEKDKEISGLIPFNRYALINLSKKKRGKYE